MKNLTQLLFTLFCLCLPAMLQAQDKDDSKYLVMCCSRGGRQSGIHQRIQHPGMSQMKSTNVCWLDGCPSERE